MSCGCNPCQGHCDSDAFDSSCNDSGRGYPMSVIQSCDKPDYTPIPGIRAEFVDGEFVLPDQ
mgnify:CR=1 FL=1